MNTVIWDWNGTLLDDAWVGLEAMNDILARSGKSLLRDMEDYRARFCFPVQTYYEHVGLGADVFPVVSHQWIDAYLRMAGACRLRLGASRALEAFRAAGWRQVVLSASKRENLLAQMARYDILPYFDQVLGLDHIYATSKEALGKEWLKNSGLSAADCVMIGDTLHDSDVARALGCPCVLVTGGHQSADILRTAGLPVAASPADACKHALCLRYPSSSSPAMAETR